MTVDEKIINGMKHVYIKYTDEEKAEMVEKAKKSKEEHDKKLSQFKK